MEKTKILLDITTFNPLENSRSRMENCPGYWINQGTISYQEEDGTSVTLSFDEACLWIDRKGEHQTQMICNINEKTKARVTTEFGEFEFDVETSDIKTSKKMFSVQYSLKQGDQLINKVHIRWIIKEVQA